MSGSTLDVSSGEVIALTDYCLDRSIRKITDYIAPGTSTCILCGPIGFGANADTHLYSKQHRTRVSAYYACLQSLYALQAADIAENEDSVSRRETILMYLGNRISRSVITGGLSSYNNVAVAYLLRRRGTGDLLTAYKDIRGSPVPSNKGMCTICMDRPSTIMFESCRHVCTCSTCASQLLGTEDNNMKKQCPICRVRTTTCTVFIV